MAIRNIDGSIYKTTNTLQQFDPNNPELDLFNIWDQEVIEIGGTPLFYYEVFINMNTVDPLYREDRGKIWSNNPVTLYGYYEPIPSQNYMGTFGIDAPDELMFEFNFKDTLRRLNHVPKVGARIFSPHKRENWVIKQRNVQEFKLWGELRLQVMCERFQESLTTSGGKAAEKSPGELNMNDIKDLKS